MLARRFCLFLLILFSSLSAWPQLMINEIMAANSGFHMEEDFYNFADWVEIRNTGTSAVNLGDDSS